VLRITHRIEALCAVLTAAAAVLLAVAGPAHAEGAAAAADCAPAPSTKPFTAWNHIANKVHIPNGGFETGEDCWSLSSGAAVQAGNETEVRARSGAASLSLPAGGSATSAEMEIGLAYPTLRFFARNDAPSAGRLAVHVLFRTPDNTPRQLKIADLSAGESWQPTRTILLVANLLALYPGWDGKVAFRFTASDATWHVDDVFVDPYER
jgi:hypothetical protein